jgi:hypothetical protein
MGASPGGEMDATVRLLVFSIAVNELAVLNNAADTEDSRCENAMQ